jgi:transcriptional regulator with XRE-family HTH domain
MPMYSAAPTVAAGLLRTARDRTGLSQRDLAERAGITQQSVSAYETGRRDPTLATLMRLIEATGLELRFRLEAADGHDSSVRAFMESLPAGTRGRLEAEIGTRTAAARLRRVRGH